MRTSRNLKQQQQSQTPSKKKNLIVAKSSNSKAKNKQKKSKAKANTPLQKENLKKLRNCLYAYNANVFDIPLLSESKPLFLSVLNKSGYTQTPFKLNDLKNYAKKDRIPEVLLQGNTDYVKHFLEEQEPITTFLSSLAVPLQEPSENSQSDALLQ